MYDRRRRLIDPGKISIYVGPRARGEHGLLDNKEGRLAPKIGNVSSDYYIASFSILSDCSAVLLHMIEHFIA